MKLIKNLTIGIISILIIASLLLVFTGNTHLFKGVVSTYLVGKTGPSIDDQDVFETRIVGDATYQPWKISKDYNKEQDASFLKKIEKLEPVAFLVVKDDAILYEKYWKGYSDSSMTNSFSVAKSFIGLLVGIALDEGKINSIDDPVGNYLLEFKDHPELTIKHLLTMSSGINFDEDYNSPVGYMAKAYYGGDLKKLTSNYKVTEVPGIEWKYLGGNTLILSFLLEKVTGKTISEYMSEKVWQRIGAKNPAFWSLDNNGVEKSYCCFYSNARDFARIGKIYLNKGRWNNSVIVSKKYVKESVQPTSQLKDKYGKEIDFYGYHWWTAYYKGMDIFYARGIQGQFIIGIPDKQIIIVRLGNKRGEKLPNNHPSDLYTYLDFALGL